MRLPAGVEWAVQPVDDAEAILKYADYHQTWPTAEIFDQSLSAQR
jgi:hypothetical protein